MTFIIFNSAFMKNKSNQKLITAQPVAGNNANYNMLAISPGNNYKFQQHKKNFYYDVSIKYLRRHSIDDNGGGYQGL